MIPLTTSAIALVANALTLSDFEALHADLQPDPGETWRTIPWETSLLRAQEQAARERKPLFIWAMDGHPLGCT